MARNFENPAKISCQSCFLHAVSSAWNTVSCAGVERCMFENRSDIVSVIHPFVNYLYKINKNDQFLSKKRLIRNIKNACKQTIDKNKIFWCRLFQKGSVCERYLKKILTRNDLMRAGPDWGIRQVT